MDGELHYRQFRSRLRIRPAGPRLLRAAVLRWGEPVRLSNGTLEWFTRDIEPPDKPAVLTLKHYGPPVGRVIQWRSTLLGLDAVVLADETPGGYGVLELVDRWGDVPISPAFVGFRTNHSTGRQWQDLSIPELAVVHAGELPWAKLRRLAA